MSIYMPLPLLFSRNHAQKIEKFQAAEHKIQAIHAKKIKAIAKADEKAHNLKHVLEKNHISIQINNATGGIYGANTRPN